MLSSGRITLPGQEVFNFLHRLQLSHEFDKFLTSEILHISQLRQLRDEDLQKIGISDFNERHLLLQGIGRLKEIELQPRKGRAIFYNSAQPNDPDYSECAEFDLTRCPCKSGGVNCAKCSQVPFDVGRFGESEEKGITTSNSGRGKEKALAGWKAHLRGHVINDGVNFLKIPDEAALRLVASKYAMELSSSPYANGGGASFSSTSTSSSSSSGYPSSISSTKAWLKEGLPLLDLQQQVLHQLREIWLEEKRKLLSHEAHFTKNSETFCGSRSMRNLNTWRYDKEEVPSPGIKTTSGSPRKWGTARKQRNRNEDMRNGSEKFNYTPGVYQPSSCLRNHDEIYDYIPPKMQPEGYCEQGTEDPLESCIYSRSEMQATGYPQTEQLRCNSYTGVARRRDCTNNSAMPAYISGTSCYGYGYSRSRATSSSCGYLHEGYETGENLQPNGSKTLHRIHKLGKSLGLSKLLQNIGLQGDGSIRRKEGFEDSSEVLYGMTRTSEQTLERLRRSQNYNPGFQEDNCMERNENQTDGISKSSDETLLDTINRLKHAELMERKDKITQEHARVRQQLEGQFKNTDSEQFSSNFPNEERERKSTASNESFSEIFSRHLNSGRRKRNSLSDGEDGKLARRYNKSNNCGERSSCSSVRSLPKRREFENKCLSEGNGTAGRDILSPSFYPNGCQVGDDNDNDEQKTTICQKTADEPAEIFPFRGDSQQQQSNFNLKCVHTIEDLLKSIGQEVHTSVFLTQGFETLELFVELEEEDLDKLGITEEESRLRILDVVNKLRELYAAEENCNIYKYQSYKDFSRSLSSIYHVYKSDSKEVAEGGGRVDVHSSNSLNPLSRDKLYKSFQSNKVR